MSEHELQRLIKDKKKAESKGNLRDVAQFCNAIGEIYAKLGKHEEAIQEHEMELGLSEALDDTVGAAVANRKIGECYCDMVDYTSAVRHQQLYLDLAEKADSDVERQRAHATLGRTYLLKSESLSGPEADRALAKSELSFFRSLEACHKLKEKVQAREYMEMKARLLLNLGIVHDQKGDAKKCLDLIRQATSIAERSNLHEDLYRCQYTLSDIHERNGQTSQALRCIETALKMANKTKDKFTEWDAIEKKAKIYLHLKDFNAARKCLKKTVKRKAPSDHHQRQLESLLLSVRKLSHYDLKLSSSQNDLQLCLAMSEKTGDVLANLRLYKPALKYYHDMLDCALSLKKAKKALIPVYVSLAQTYRDDRQYKQAVVYFTKELECWADDHQQGCRTLLNIAEAQELGGEDYSVIKESYADALSEAAKAKDKKLQFHVLKTLSIVQKAFKDTDGLPTTNARLLKLKDQYGFEMEDELSDAESSEVQDEDDSDASLEDFTDSDTSEEEFAGRARGANIKRNEKGETPLHRACIDGKLKTVKSLLEKGHPVNPRDFCGWLPIHEAANHGHVEVLEALLDHGAWINDRGGSQCGGVTPLHDAASCGNLEVIRLLVTRGVNVHSKDDEGNTALDSLHGYLARSEDCLTQAEINEVVSLKMLLKRTMQGNNPHFGSDQFSDLHLSKKITNRNRCTQQPALLEVATDEDSSEHLQPDLTNLDELQNPNTARKAYRNAMQELGSATSRPSPKTQDAVERCTSGPALVDNEAVMGNDWLIEDMRPATKRKRGDVDDVFKATQANRRSRSSSGTRPPTQKKKRRSCIDSDEDNSDGNSAMSTFDPIQNTDLYQIDSQDSVEDLTVDIDPFPSQTTGMRVTSRKSKQLTLTQFTCATADTRNGRSRMDLTHPTPTDIPAAQHQVVAVLKFRVKIKDKVLLVPIQKSEEPPLIALLAAEASERYYKLCNLRPRLSLVKDGAILSHDEPIELVLTNNDEVEGIVDSWDLPPLTVRYADACKAAKAVSYRNINAALLSCEAKGVLNLARLALKPVQLMPVTRALQCETIKELYLQGNRLGDSGFEHLAKIFPLIPSLGVLNLSCNNLTCTSLKRFVDCLQDAGNTGEIIQNLHNVELSHNPLGDGCTPHLSKLMRLLPGLLTLKLASCSFTLKFFQVHRTDLADTMKVHKLQHLDMSYNNIGSIGVELLLTCVNPERLASLHLSSVIRTFSGNTITKHMERYITQPSCMLQHLTMDACCVTEDMVPDICKFLSSSNSLRSLSLCDNSKLNLANLRQIVEASNESATFESLGMNGLSFHGCLGTDFVDSISNKLCADRPLKTLDFGRCIGDIPQIDQESLQHVWKEKWEENARCSFVDGFVKLSVLDET